MAGKARTIFMNFNRGELSPALQGRLDLNQYYNGVSELTNFICLPYGGVIKRGGFVYVAPAKYHNSSVRLIPFCFSEFQNYILEFGHLYIRFYTDCGQVVVPEGSELVTNGTFNENINGWINRSIGTGSISWNESTQRMDLTGGTNGIGWAEQQITVTKNEPYLLKFDVFRNDLTLRVGDVSCGDNIYKDRTFGPGCHEVIIYALETTSIFLQFLNPNNNEAQLDNVSLKHIVPFEISSPYTEDDLWGIKYAQDDENLYLVHADHPPMLLTRTGPEHIDWDLSEIEFIDGPYLEEETAPIVSLVDIGNGVAPGAVARLTAAMELWDPDHVGALWRLKYGNSWGYVKILTYNSPTSVDVLIKTSCGAAGQKDAWREGAWSKYNGYPRCITFFEGRAVFANTYEQPQTIWGSKTYHYNDMTPGTLADDAYTFTAAELNIIRWIAHGRKLAIGALNAEAIAEGPGETAISPTDPPMIKTQTSHGSADVQPLNIGNTIIFVQKAWKKLHEFVYRFDVDSYVAPDLTLLSSHLFQDGIMELTYQLEPYSIIWLVPISGEYLIGCTYNRLESVIGWHKHQTDGIFESIAVIPYGGEDQLWAVVIRNINDEMKRYIEVYDKNVYADSAIFYSGPPTSKVRGLQHLVGCEVCIVGDNAVYPPQVVPSNGELTLDPPASEIYVGLPYVARLVTNRPEVNIGGTSQGLPKKWNRVTVRVLNTIGLKVNGQIIPARDSYDLMDYAPEPFSGDVGVVNLGWDVDGRIEVVQELPFPAEIVCIIGSLIVGDE